MAKLVKVYQDETITITLTFRNLDFVFAWPPCVDGRRTAKEKGFDDQFREVFTADEDIDILAAIVGLLDLECDDDIEDALERLQEWE